jgi:hypothetical protein
LLLTLIDVILVDTDAVCPENSAPRRSMLKPEVCEGLVKRLCDADAMAIVEMNCVMLIRASPFIRERLIRRCTMLVMYALEFAGYGVGATAWIEMEQADGTSK